jgi:hypothetical protein
MLTNASILSLVLTELVRFDNVIRSFKKPSGRGRDDEIGEHCLEGNCFRARHGDARGNNLVYMEPLAFRNPEFAQALLVAGDGAISNARNNSDVMEEAERPTRPRTENQFGISVLSERQYVDTGNDQPASVNALGELSNLTSFSSAHHCCLEENMNRIPNSALQNIERVVGDKLQCAVRRLNDGRNAVVISRYFRRPLEVNHEPPTLTPQQLEQIATELGGGDVTVETGITTDEIWGCVFDNLPTIVIIPSAL